MYENIWVFRQISFRSIQPKRKKTSICLLMKGKVLLNILLFYAANLLSKLDRQNSWVVEPSYEISGCFDYDWRCAGHDSWQGLRDRLS